MSRICLILLMLVLVSSCQRNKPYDLKSPCMSKDGPCVRRPVNTWLN
ncbi:hypothetical protein [Candidatus Deianiraea vastatrix]|uniref:Uncharacterized protein n=1 Tax=Candidatus Deianiraea vastatrix TaxID=2163644 RepID=A0A5B8XES5_9RICK|nr:hypothetical protein [Candidatus Deianiraea vastatrix]QED23808.1 hypothetical protein Deia_01026 [Candidatus Deianiraea vastatrix]